MIAKKKKHDMSSKYCLKIIEMCSLGSKESIRVLERQMEEKKLMSAKIFFLNVNRLLGIRNINL